MKDQYFGDIGDYGKYGLLRFLAQKDIKIAVNWYLTADDGSSDGKHTSYLSDSRMRKYDPELFDLLQVMVGNGERNVRTFENQYPIPEAVYYCELLEAKGESRAEKREFRKKWHAAALEACSGAELVFLDPDNGLCEEEPAGAMASLKYCFAEEAADYFNAGKNVVYHCSRGRKSYGEWDKTLGIMQRRLPEVRLAIITFHKRTQRSYVFVLHKEDFRRYANLLKSFCNRWYKLFSEKFWGVGSLTGEKTGESFHVVGSDGTEMTLEECEDGWISMKFSDKPNTVSMISIDTLISRLKW